MDTTPNEVLRDLRVEAGLTQRDLADRFGWTQGFVSQLENGERPIHRHALVIADGMKREMKRLGYTVEDLLRGTRPRSSSGKAPGVAVGR